MPRVLAPWCCQSREDVWWNGGSAEHLCPSYSRIGMLASKRQLCAYHALMEYKLIVSHESRWQPGELDAMRDRAETVLA